MRIVFIPPENLNNIDLKVFGVFLNGRWRCAHTLTVGDIRRSKTVVHEDTVGFSYFQIHHVCGVFQGSHGVLVGHFLQTRAVHLKHTPRARLRWDRGRNHGHGWRLYGVSLQPEVCLLFAAGRLCVRFLLRWSWWRRYCCLLGCAGSLHLRLYWNRGLEHQMWKRKTSEEDWVWVLSLEY